MSKEYDSYLESHKSNVQRGYNWLQTNLPKLFTKYPIDDNSNILAHDQSKSEADEYEAYDAYFYGEKTPAVEEAFRRAWLLHIHRNPHHWQYWVLINDDPGEGEICLEMPHNYIFEMICDWWAFSWSKGNLSEIFSWYDEHSAYIKLAPKTREIVEDILWELRGRLGYNVLAHHGIKGQKWGVRNGPPYPLEKSSGSDKIKEEQKSRSFNIPRNKFTDYALNPEKAPDKARVFESALGYNKDNCDQLIEDIKKRADIHKMVEKGDNGYGMRYEQIIKLKGPNEKEANVLTAWIDDDKELRLTSVYVTKKEETK